MRTIILILCRVGTLCDMKFEPKAYLKCGMMANTQEYWGRLLHNFDLLPSPLLNCASPVNGLPISTLHDHFADATNAKMDVEIDR